MIESMQNAFDLGGKVAIVTGGNRGIGRGIVAALAQSGADVAIVARNAETGNAAVAQLSAEHPAQKFAFYTADITDTQQCKAAVEGVIADFGKVDILVNNAGVGTQGALLDNPEDLEPWRHCLDVDLLGAVRMSYFACRHMRDAGIRGRVINISSNAGAIVNQPVLLGAYSSAKAGLNMLTKNLAFELGAYGIRVNAIAPGYTVSDLNINMPDADRAVLVAKMPSGRFGRPIEIGALTVYLASDASDMMTGNICTIDGGYSLAN
jgi:NAD(P)-dependent dehydrogenase (short-subunit alcohol dehydrogenase family)